MSSAASSAVGPAPAPTRTRAPGTARGTGPLLVWGLLYLVAGVTVATASAWEIYRTPRLVLVAAVGTALGAGVVLLVRAIRRPSWLAPVLIAVGYGALVVPVAIPSALGSPVAVLRGVRDGIVAIVVGWKQVLTLDLPLGEYQAVLVPFFVLIVAGTALATHLIAHDGRGTEAVAGVVVGLAVFGIVFGGSTASTGVAFGPFRLAAPREVLLCLVLVLVSVLWLVGRARLRRAAALRVAHAQSSSVRQGAETFALRLRRRIAGVLLVVVALVAGVAVAPLAESLVPRQALRDDVDPLVVVRQQPSPLAAYRSWFSAGAFDAELFTVTGGDGVDRLRFATLGDYDGGQFRVAAGADGVRFVRLPGGRVATGAEVGVAIRDGFRGIWMPVPRDLATAPHFSGERAAELSEGFYVDAASGSAIDVASAGEGHGLLPGDAYTVTAGVPEAPRGFADEPGAEAKISADAYPQLAEWVERQGVPRTGAGLAELLGMLRERGYLSHAVSDGEGSAAWIADLEARAPYAFMSSRSGHSAARIETLFADLNGRQSRAGAEADEASLVAAVGDDEQFVVAAALLARYLGFESRVVLGVRLAAEDGSSLPVCVDTCTGADVSAWVEVRSPTGGWSVFDVTPQFEVAPVTVTDGEKLPENPTEPDQQSVEPLDPPQAQRDDSASPDDEPVAAPAWWESLLPVLRVLGTVGLVALLLALPALVLVLAKVVRRRSRRAAATPEVGMVGAWAELVARYVDLGYDVPENGSRVVVAQAVGRPRALVLAAAVDRAVFAEHPPERAATVESWDLVDQERRELGAAVAWHRRVLAALAPASLVRDLGRTPRR